MTIKEAEEFFYGFGNHFWDLGLDNLRQFLGYLGNPQDKVKVIHVAGTNGKGSVSAFLSEILTEAGYRVGRYNSPVVFHKLENITINNVPISEDSFAGQVEQMKPFILKSDRENKLPTIFELETALAYHYFAENNCDFVVMECGLGGTLDATNVTNRTILSILTSISMDHMSYLGSTLSEIAACKAGICKPSVPVVMMQADVEAMDVVQQVCWQKNCAFHTVHKENIKIEKESLFGQEFWYRSAIGSENRYRIRMAGIFQTENAALVIEAVYLLRQMGVFISDEALMTGLEKTKLPGRFELIAHDPIVILDGAHNADAAERLKQNLERLLADYHKIFVMGVFSDKDYKKVIELTCPLADMVFTVQSKNPRALSGKNLMKCIKTRGIEAQAADNATHAVRLAKNYAGQLFAETGLKSAIICFGSFSYLKEAADAVDWD